MTRLQAIGPGATARGAALYFPRLATAGGAQRMVCKLAEGLHGRGRNVHMVSCDDGDAECFYPLPSGVSWTRLGNGRRLREKFDRARVLARALSRLKAHALIGFVMSGDKTVYAAARASKTPLIAAERNAPSMYHLRYGAARRWSNFALLHLCDRIVVQQPGFVSGYPASLRSRISVIANPVEPREARARPASPDARGRFVLLAVSRLDPVQKRLGLSLEAFAMIAGRFPQWDLRIVGDGPDRANVANAVRRLGLDGRVELVPEKAEIFAEYESAHLFAMPSRWEGFPNALAEAMSCGLPAVGFEDARGVADMIEDESAGWLARGRDGAADLADALAEAMTDDAARAEKGRRASIKMTRFQPGGAVTKWIELLDGLDRRIAS